jgi:thiamine-monophosphate kinase
VTVSDLTEQELIARIRKRLPAAPPWMLVGVGDDAAVVEPARNQLEVLTVDALVEGVHFERRFTPADAIGHRALAVNLSDLAAMGATPRLALLSLALPETLPCADFDGLIEGLVSLAAVHRIHVAGGNLTRSPGPLMVDVTAIGSVKPRRALTRSGARPGDGIYVTGTVGGAAAGLQSLREAADPAPAMASCVKRYLYPDPRVRAGSLLGRNRAATACMDLSDGLADGVRRIAEASGVGATIDAGAVPIEPAARAWFESRGLDPIIEALSGGDDYELVFTVSPRLRSRLRAVARHGGVPLTRIGSCTPGTAVTLVGEVGGRGVEAPFPRGFSHFR